MRIELKLRTYLLRKDEVNHRNQQQRDEKHKVHFFFTKRLSHTGSFDENMCQLLLDLFF